MMHQPASLYVRSMRRNALSFYRRGKRKLQKIVFKTEAGSAPPVREARPVVDMATLRAGLHQLGLTSGDTVIVHSGISHIGKVVGGPKAIFELIRDMVGESGHVLFPVFPFNNLMMHYLGRNPTFDVRTAPSKMGALTEYALKVPGGMRSIHPSHSVLAFGPHSNDFVASHHLDTKPFAECSPFARLVESNGKILLIGVGLNSTTSFHRTEDRLGDRFPVRVYGRPSFRIPCIDWNGQTVEVSTPAHDPFVSRVRDCNLVRTEFLREGVLRELPIGSGTIGMIDAGAMDRLLERLCFSRHLTIYGRLWG
jgi:aminoglycoside 3-N-acetyltransferase